MLVDSLEEKMRKTKLVITMGPALHGAEGPPPIVIRDVSIFDSEAGKMLARELFTRVGRAWTREQSGVRRIALAVKHARSAKICLPQRIRST